MIFTVVSTAWNSSHIWHSQPKHFYQHHVTIANDFVCYDLEDQQKHWCCHGHMMNNTPAGRSCIATVVITGTVCLELLTVGQVCTEGNLFEKVKSKRLRQAVWKLADARVEGLAQAQEMAVMRLSMEVSAVCLSIKPMTECPCSAELIGLTALGCNSKLNAKENISIPCNVLMLKGK